MALPVRLEVNTKGMDFAVHLTGNSSSVVEGTVELLVPLAVSTKGMGSANQMITNNSFVVVDLAEHLALLGLSTKEMGSAEATSLISDTKAKRQISDYFFPA